MSLKNRVIPLGIDPGIGGLVAQRLNHYATAGPNKGIYVKELGIAIIIVNVVQQYEICMYIYITDNSGDMMGGQCGTDGGKIIYWQPEKFH
jgi:hypothetical protein